MLDAMETARLCRSAELLVRSGIGLAEGFFLLAKEDPGNGAALEAAAAALDDGTPLSAALEGSGLIPPYVSRLLRIGEETGRGEQTLTALAEDFEEQDRLRRQIRGAVAYPTLLFVVMLAVLGVLLVKVLPVFDQVYASLGARMNGAAAAMLHLGRLVERVIPVLLILLGLVAAAALAYRWFAPFRRWVGGLFRRSLGDRGIARSFNDARFAQGLAMGLSSGLPLEAAAELAGQLLAHIPQAALRCEACAAALTQGLPLREALERGSFLSPAQSRLLSLGVQSGSADQVMHVIAGQLLEEAREKLDRAVSRVEPAMVLTGSLLVGTILLAAMLPLLDILSVLG